MAEPPAGTAAGEPIVWVRPVDGEILNKTIETDPANPLTLLIVTVALPGEPEVKLTGATAATL